MQLNSAADGSTLLDPKKISFGPPITNKSDVTERIQRAQRAILNPSIPPDVFLSGADTGHEVSFSSNRIVVHVSGPDITDLNFIDLPGSYFEPLWFVFNILDRSLCWGGGGRDEYDKRTRNILYQEAKLHNPTYCFLREYVLCLAADINLSSDQRI